MAKSLIGRLLSNIKQAEDVELARRTFYDLMYKKFDGELEEKEVESIFDWALGEEEKKRTPGWRDAAPLIRKIKEEKKHDLKFEEDMASWNHISFAGAEQIEDIVSFILPDNKKISLSAADILSLSKFRAAFFSSTTILLPKISQTSYERFIRSISMKRILDQGLSVSETVEEALQKWIAELEFCADNKEALLSLEDRPCVKFEGNGKVLLFFKFLPFTTYIQRLLFGTKRTQVSEALKDLGAHPSRTNKFNFWIYERMVD